MSDEDSNIGKRRKIEPVDELNNEEDVSLLEENDSSTMISDEESFYYDSASSINDEGDFFESEHYSDENNIEEDKNLENSEIHDEKKSDLNGKEIEEEKSKNIESQDDKKDDSKESNSLNVAQRIIISNVVPCCEVCKLYGPYICAYHDSLDSQDSAYALTSEEEAIAAENEYNFDNYYNMYRRGELRGERSTGSYTYNRRNKRSKFTRYYDYKEN